MEPKHAPPDELPLLRPPPRFHGKHRGGSWKVAYADFVTALMALFIVLWLMNSSRQVQQAISAYFRDPKAAARAALVQPVGRGGTGGDSISLDQSNIRELKQKLEQAIHDLPEFGGLQKQVQISITPEGLRVELLETEQGLFFASGRPEPSSNGERILSLLARELGKLKNPVLVEGHTDSRPYRYTGLNGYTNWELSVDRANAARRFMQDHGVDPNQVAQVRGFADKRLLDPANPNDSRNRRISVVVEYNEPPPSARKPDPFGQPASRAPVLR
jgi:chemotaxis protein MotB